MFVKYFWINIFQSHPFEVLCSGCLLELWEQTNIDNCQKIKIFTNVCRNKRMSYKLLSWLLYLQVHFEIKQYSSYIGAYLLQNRTTTSLKICLYVWVFLMRWGPLCVKLKYQRMTITSHYNNRIIACLLVFIMRKVTSNSHTSQCLGCETWIVCGSTSAITMESVNKMKQD